jgi:ribosomal protein S14
MIYQPMPDNQCHTCGQFKPWTRKYFVRTTQSGVVHYCIECKHKGARDYYQANRERIKAKSKKYAQEHASERQAAREIYYEGNKERILNQQRDYRQEHAEEIRIQKRGYWADNRDHILAQKHEYYQQHKEQLYTSSERWRRANLERVRARQIQWRRANKEKLRDYYYHYRRKKRDDIRRNQTKYNRSHPEVRRAEGYRRKAREHGLPFAFTSADWQRALAYWGHKCAVCGRPRGFWHSLAADHWIPLADPRPDNPGTVPENILPLCHGIDGCNNFKHARNPIEWLAEYLGPKQAEEKLSEIEQFFKWVRQQSDSDHP